MAFQRLIRAAGDVFPDYRDAVGPEGRGRDFLGRRCGLQGRRAARQQGP